MRTGVGVRPMERGLAHDRWIGGLPPTPDSLRCTRHALEAFVHNLVDHPQGTPERPFSTSKCQCRVRQSRHETGSLGHRSIDARGRRRSRRRDKGTASLGRCRGRDGSRPMRGRRTLAALAARGGAVAQRLPISPTANGCCPGVRRSTQHPHWERGIECAWLGAESTVE